MGKLQLPDITLLGIDCVNVERLQAAIDISEKNIKFGATKLLTSLSTNDSRAVKISPIGSTQEFSSFCIKELYNYVDTEYVLLIQYDGFVLNTDMWAPEFLQYDYIGAPWNVGSWETEDFPKSLYGKLVVGNGGFSLRSKKFLEISARLALEGKIIKFHPEDVALCVWYRDFFENEGIKFAPPEIANKFSTESDIGVSNETFGFHGLYGKNMDTLIKNYPDFPIHFFLPKRRGKIIKKIKEVFTDALERYTDKDNFNVWLIFKDEDMTQTLEKQLEYYSKIGETVSVEDLQKTDSSITAQAVVFKTKIGLIPMNFYFCIKSKPFNIDENKKAF